MATPLSRPHAEVGILGQKFADALAQCTGIRRPRFLMLRRACVYANTDDGKLPVAISAEYASRFETLFRNIGQVRVGFPAATAMSEVASPDDYRPETILDSMVFGTPEQVVTKLKSYAAVGVDQFCYGASFGLPHKVAMRSLDLFITEVMPHFA
jgi:alkanesulfonate monooxygenase SsuD/methylene tetrahydromethanopterin reductase-like flavin-dependent oxidoreductase (luciferase family)